ncbi:hypothetical protein ACFE04_018139 [Oxalis oulophora]
MDVPKFPPPKGFRGSNTLVNCSYPKDSEKHLLAMKSGLTRSQVSNWFINARVRLWKPLIEEMYSEMNRRNAKQNEEENNDNRRKFIDINHQRFNGNESSEQMGLDSFDKHVKLKPNC